MGKPYFHYRSDNNEDYRLPKATFFKRYDKKKYQLLSGNNNAQFVSSNRVKKVHLLSNKPIEHSSQIPIRKKDNVFMDFKRYKVIGQGKDGVIYQLAPNQCVKVFFREETYKKELKALQVGQSSSIIPRLYDYGSNYIVMECIKGISLAKYLKKNRYITKSLVMQLINLFDELQKLNFSRQDTELRHVLMNEQGNLKVIDLKRAFTSNRPIPIKLLTELKELKLSKEFLSYVKDIRPSLYQKWRKFDES
jgi:putative serine/threonine protein kinase